MDLEIQTYAIIFTNKIIPEIERIIEKCCKNPEEGLKIYFDFIKIMTPSLKAMIERMSFPQSVCLISPRLLRNPLSINFRVHNTS